MPTDTDWHVTVFLYSLTVAVHIVYVDYIEYESCMSVVQLNSTLYNDENRTVNTYSMMWRVRTFLIDFFHTLLSTQLSHCWMKRKLNKLTTDGTNIHLNFKSILDNSIEKVLWSRNSNLRNILKIRFGVIWFQKGKVTKCLSIYDYMQHWREHYRSTTNKRNLWSV